MNHPQSTQIHASCVLLAGIGVLLRGPSGSGKSDLALRSIEAGARLVADDQVDLVLRDDRLVARSPLAIAGQLEVRGVGIVPSAAVAEAELGLVVDLVRSGEVERMPDPQYCRYLGVDLPLIALAPFEASAAAKLKLAAGEAAAGRLFAGTLVPTAP